MSTNAATLLDQLLVTINQPVVANLDRAVAAVSAAFARRSVDAHIRSPDEIRFDLDRAKRGAIKADLDGVIGRMFHTPQLYDARKAETVTMALSPILEGTPVQIANGVGGIEHTAFEKG